MLVNQAPTTTQRNWRMAAPHHFTRHGRPTGVPSLHNGKNLWRIWCPREGRLGVMGCPKPPGRPRHTGGKGGQTARSF